MAELCDSGPSERTGTEASTADLESHTIRWPESCPYYNADITDCWRARDLLYNDTAYLAPTEDDLKHIRCINLADGVPTYRELKALGKDLSPTILSTVPDAKKSAKILFREAETQILQ